MRLYPPAVRVALDRGPRHIPPLPPAVHDGPARPCLVHLVREANGEAPLEAFVAALDAAPPSARDWDLVLAMKGFSDRAQAERYASIAAHHSPELLQFDDQGLDLTVYFGAAERLRRSRYCFVNSYSEPLVAGWLDLLDAALSRPGVGIVGATGSWAATFSVQAHLLLLPSAYKGVLPSARRTVEQLREIEREAGVRSDDAQPLWRTFARKLATLMRLPGDVLPYERFPAPHVRTNAFAIEHATLARLRLRAVRKKRDAYLMEHGRRNITRQVQRLGLQALLVDNRGQTYEPHEWDRSFTFWQGEQQGLLVADNQTRRYAEGDGERRRLLSGLAWGPSAKATQ
jgi:hypothetical protein